MYLSLQLGLQEKGPLTEKKSFGASVETLYTLENPTEKETLVLFNLLRR